MFLCKNFALKPLQNGEIMSNNKITFELVESVREYYTRAGQSKHQSLEIAASEQSTKQMKK